METNASGFPIHSHATLEEALLWIAYGLPPLSQAHQEIEAYPPIERDLEHQNPLAFKDDQLTLAAKELFKALSLGKIYANGELVCEGAVGNPFPSFHEVKIDHSQWIPSNIDWERGWLMAKVPLGLSTFIDCEPDTALLVTAYEEISLATPELMALFPYREIASSPEPGSSVTAGTSESLSPPPYRSPYVEFMLWAEKELASRIESDTKENIRDWLLEKGQAAGLPMMKYKADLMATFLRHPDREKGGNPKWKNTDDNQG